MTAPTTPNPAPHGEWCHCPTCDCLLNYQFNPVLWRTGTLVIHDRDAKNQRYLLEVVGPGDGHTLTVRYVNIPEDELPPEVRGEFLNPLCVLHDPARWGISTETRHVSTGPKEGD